jgi:hypothetical protein
LRSIVRFILLGLVVGGSGCASHLSLGEPVNDDARRAALLRACPRPDVPQAVFRTLIRWGSREVSLTEVVKVSAAGGLSVAGVTDIGSTLYAVRVDPDGRGHVLRQSLPFSDQWLLDSLIADLLVPWNRPKETCQLYKQAHRTWALVCPEQGITRVFLFDETGSWRRSLRLRGARLLSRISLEWDGQSLPRILRVDNLDKHYHLVRERVSVR